MYLGIAFTRREFEWSVFFFIRLKNICCTIFNYICFHMHNIENGSSIKKCCKILR